MESPALEDIPVQKYIGKKRSLPDDTDIPPAPLVEARLPDSEPLRQVTPPKRERENNVPATAIFTDAGSMTPRHRRPLQALRTGFTPVRSQNTLRVGPAQPSPIRKSSASQDLLAPVISDVTNSPPKAKRTFTIEPETSTPRAKPATRGWLDKLQSRGMNPLSRTRQRSDDVGRS